MFLVEVNERDNRGRDPSLERHFPLLDGPKDMDDMILAFTMVGGHE
jgi:hypothetical protein